MIEPALNQDQNGPTQRLDRYHVHKLHCTILLNSIRYLGKENTGMSILDIGILTGFELDEASKKQVSKLSFNLFTGLP